MRQRHGDEPAVLLRQAERARERERGMDDAEMRELRALRLAGGAGRVEDDRDVLLVAIDGGTGAAAGEQVGEGLGVRGFAADREAMRKLGDFRRRRNEFRERPAKYLFIVIAMK